MLSLRKKIDTPKTVAITGVLMQLVVWMYVGVLIVSAYFRSIDQNAPGTAQTVISGEFYGQVYGIYMFGGSLAVLGFMVSLEAVFRRRYRARWFFWASLFLSLPICLLYPVGTVIGLGFIVYILAKRKEFGHLVVGPQETPLEKKGTE